MKTKHALLIGATAGIGRETARLLAKEGYHVSIVGRNQVAGDELAQALNGTFIRADVSLLSEVRRVAEVVRTQVPSLDLIIHSADVLITKRVETAEGLELAIATNYYSRFLLNHLLLNEAPFYQPVRIIHIAAAGFPPGNIRAKFPLSANASSFTGHGVGQIANDFYGLALADKLRAKGMLVNILNPGMVDTDIRRNGQFPKWFAVLSPVLDLLLKPLVKTPEAYAQVVLNIARGQNADANQSVLINSKGKAIQPSGKLLDKDAQQYLWEQTEGIVLKNRIQLSNL